MKKYIKLLLILPALLWGCEDADVDTVFDESPEARTTAVINEVKQQLTDSKYGWNVYFNYDNYQKDAFYNIRFMENGQAMIRYYDWNTASVKEDETSYKLRYTQQLDLVFTTHSVLNDIVTSGGDFRFEMEKNEKTSLHFRSRNSEVTSGLGKLVLEKSEAADDFEKTILPKIMMMDDPTQSFYRVLSLDDSEEKCNLHVRSLSQAEIEWIENGEYRTEQYPIETIDGGFELKELWTFAGKSIRHFIYNVDEGWFDVTDEQGNRIGKLDYGLKPFTYPVNAGGLNGGFFVVEDASEYSPALQPYIAELQRRDPNFVTLQFYIGYSDMNVLAFLFIVGDAGDWGLFPVDFVYDKDVIEFNWKGQYAPNAGDYREVVKDVRALFTNHRFTVIPYDRSKVYLVQEEDPSIWVIITIV